MKNQKTLPNFARCFDSVRASIQESKDYFHAQNLKWEKQHQERMQELEENARQLKERAQQFEIEVQQREKEAQLSRQVRENESKKREIEIDRQIKEDHYQMIELKKELKGIGLSNGNFAEEYFSNSFYKEQKNFFGERFDFMRENLNGRRSNYYLTDEFDIVLFNCNAVAIIEVKYKARPDNIYQVLRKPESFRHLYPEHSHCKVFLGLAAMVFSQEMVKLCSDEGIAVIKQVGENVVIIDEDLKVF